MNREEQIFNMITETIHSFGGQLSNFQVFMFGSRATGTARPNSDFDVGINGHQPVPAKLFSAIADRLDDLPTLYKIDWVDFTRASKQFVQIASREKVIIHE